MTLRQNLMTHLRSIGAPIDFVAMLLAYIDAAGGDLDRTVTAEEFGKFVVKHTAQLTGVPEESLRFDWTPTEKVAEDDEFPAFIIEGDSGR